MSLTDWIKEQGRQVGFNRVGVPSADHSTLAAGSPRGETSPGCFS
jgi:hypothetical protein